MRYQICMSSVKEHQLCDFHENPPYTCTPDQGFQWGGGGEGSQTTQYEINLGIQSARFSLYLGLVGGGGGWGKVGGELGFPGLADPPLLKLHSVVLRFLYVLLLPGGTTTDGNPNGRRKSKSQIQSDGFRYGTKIRMDPYSQQIIQPIRWALTSDFKVLQ